MQIVNGLRKVVSSSVVALVLVGCAVDAGDFPGELDSKTQEIKASQKITMVAIKFYTGSDDKRGGSEVNFQLKMKNGTVNTYNTDDAATWPGNSNTGFYYAQVPVDTVYGDISKVGVQMFSHNGFIQTDDNWNMNGFDVWVGLPNGSWSIVASPAGNPLKRFTGASQQFWFTWPAGT